MVPSLSGGVFSKLFFYSCYLIAIFAVLTKFISFFYYIRLVNNICFERPENWFYSTSNYTSIATLDLD